MPTFCSTARYSAHYRHSILGFCLDYGLFRLFRHIVSLFANVPFFFFFLCCVSHQPLKHGASYFTIVIFRFFDNFLLSLQHFPPSFFSSHFEDSEKSYLFFFFTYLSFLHLLSSFVRLCRATGLYTRRV